MPVSGQSLAVFRMFFGLVMLWEVQRYFQRGWINRYWIDPEFNFKYEWFEWVQPLSTDGMAGLFVLLGVLSVSIAVGFMYRLSSILFFLIFTYTFLLEQARYLNHFYLVILISFIMIVIPAHRVWSVDAVLFKSKTPGWVPNWSVLLVQLQLGVAYFFGGVAKMNTDWLSGSPLNAWLPRRADFPLLGPYFEEDWAALMFSYSGLALDLAALPLLMYRRTRPYIMIGLILFHFMNDRLFTIGIFPWFTVAAMVIYFPPSWPGQFFRFMMREKLTTRLAVILCGILGVATAIWFHEGINYVPVAASFIVFMLVIWDFYESPQLEKNRIFLISRPKVQPFVLAGLSVWMLVQILLPIRHVVIPGSPSWTEEGHRFAWHMKLRSKSCEQQFYLENYDGSLIGIQGMPFLQNWQRRKVASRPQLVEQYAKFISSLHDDQPVYADIRCSLNGGPYRQLISPDTDLTQVRFRDSRPNDWIHR